MKLEQRLLALDTVALEARYLDEQKWDAWLDLYFDKAVFWIPTWKSDSELSDDPMTELSYMYLEGKNLLSERVERVTMGKSVASLPIPRTTHLVCGSVVESDDHGQSVTVNSAWNTHVFLHKDCRLVLYAGRYIHSLRWDNDRYRIQKKTVILTNDVLQSQLDFFYI